MDSFKDKVASGKSGEMTFEMNREKREEKQRLHLTQTHHGWSCVILKQKTKSDRVISLLN